jgi:hypothetical protein
MKPNPKNGIWVIASLLGGLKGKIRIKEELEDWKKCKWYVDDKIKSLENE